MHKMNIVMLLAAFLGLPWAWTGQCGLASAAEVGVKTEGPKTAVAAAKTVRYVVNEKYEGAPQFHSAEITACVEALIKAAGFEALAPSNNAADAALTINVEGRIPKTPSGSVDTEGRAKIRIVVSLKSQGCEYQSREHLSSWRIGSSVENAYKKALASSSLSLEVATAIAKLKDSDRVKLLCIVLGEKRAAASTRAWCAEAIGEIAAKEALPFLLEAVKDPSAEVRERAIWVLGRIRDKSSADVLVALLKDSDAEVRSVAAWALGRICEPKTQDALVLALSDKDPEVRLSCVESLGEFGKTAVPALITASKDVDAKVREEAVNGLGRSKDPAAVPALIAALEDANEDVRLASPHALEIIGDESAVKALIGALGSKYEGVWQFSSISLGRLGQRALEPLIAALANPAPRVRERAVGVLREIGDKAVVPQLMRLEKEDPDEDVRFWAKMALKKMRAK